MNMHCHARESGHPVTTELAIMSAAQDLNGGDYRIVRWSLPTT